MLDDVWREAVRAALRDLVRVSPLLAEMVVPSVQASGTNAGRAARAPGPRSPVAGHPFAVEHEVWMLLSQIVGVVCRSSGVPGPRHREDGPPVSGVLSVRCLSQWLLDHVEDLAAHDRAVDAAEVICQQSRRVSDLVDPPVSAADPAPGGEHGPAHPGPVGTGEDGGGRGVGRYAPGGVLPDPDGGDAAGAGKWGTASQVAQGAALLGHPVSAKTVRRWADASPPRIRSLTHLDGRGSYSLEDVVREASQMQARIDQEIRRMV